VLFSCAGFDEEAGKSIQLVWKKKFRIVWGMTVQCPTCFEYFEVSEVAPEDRGTQMDYDCEVCCRPLILIVGEDGELYSRGMEE